MFLSQHPVHHESHVRPSFMSRFSLLLPRKKSYSSKSKHKSQSDSLTQKQFTSDERNSFPSCSTLQSPDQNQAEETGYSSIHDIEALNQESQEDGSSPPPIPPKSFDDVYAQVNKKGSKTEINSIKKSERSIKKHYFKYEEQPEGLCEHKNPKKSHISDSSSGELENNEIRNKQSSQTSRHPRQRRRHRILNDSSTLVPAGAKPSQSHMQSHKKKSGHKDNHNVKPLESMLEEEKRRAFEMETEIELLKKRHLMEIQHLREEMRQSDHENSVLRERIMILLQQENEWQETMAKLKKKEQEHVTAIESNAELNRRVAKLEIDTQQEVQLLCQKVNVIRHEKDLAEAQLNSSLQDFRSLQKKYEILQKQSNSNISVETHVNALEENKKFIETLKGKMQKEMDKLRKMYRDSEDEKNDLAIQVILLKDNDKRFQMELTEMKNIQDKISEEKNAISLELEQAQQQNNKASNLLKSVLQTAEEVTIERNSLLKKVEFQENNSEKFHSTIIQHTYNVGRLEECISNLRKRLNDEVAKNAVSQHVKELDLNTMRETYERQLAALKRLISHKDSLLDTLGEEKMKLETDLQNLWEAMMMSKKDTVKLNSKYEGIFLNKSDKQESGYESNK